MKYHIEIPHYAISIIRGRGIDNNAMHYLLKRYPPQNLLFIDGWIGKGAILTELQKEIARYKGVSSEIGVISDPANVTELCGTHKDILIPQYHFGIKKIYSFKFKHINIMDETIQNFKKEIMKIHKELKKRLDDELITEQFNVSVIDDITSPMENSGFIFKIIEMSFDSDLHSLYIDYINEFIILKLQKKDIFTKEVLIKLKMIKYITQILLFIKIYIKLNGVTKDNLSKEELKECSTYITNDAVILTHFNLLELKKTQDIFKSDDIIKDNELALEELINFNKKIIDIINKIEKNIK